MFLRTIITCIVSSFMMSPLAKAGWQNTEWGMTIDETEKAIGKKITEIPENNGKFYSAPFNLALSNGDRLSVTLVFGFDTEKKGLESIAFHSDIKSVCRKVIQNLELNYGSPGAIDESDFDIRFTWLDKNKDNLLEYLSLSKQTYDNCLVSYKPITESGL